MADQSRLRPIERRMLRLVGDGVGEEEIARRFRRSPRFVNQVLGLARLPRSGTGAAAGDQRLRPLERRVLRWREDGASYEELGPRFRRSPEFVQRVEELARWKEAR